MYGNPPRLMTVREIAKTGLMPEHALRFLIKQGQIRTLKIGAKNLINYDRLIEQLDSVGRIKMED